MELCTQIASCVAGPVTNLCITASGTVMSLKDNIKSLEQETKELQSKGEEMIKKLEEAELEDKEPTSEVTLWLENVGKFPGDMLEMAFSFS